MISFWLVFGCVRSIIGFGFFYMCFMGIYIGMFMYLFFLVEFV